MKPMRSLLCGLFVLFTFTNASIGLGQVKSLLFSDFLTVSSMKACWINASATSANFQGMEWGFVFQAKLTAKSNLELIQAKASFHKSSGEQIAPNNPWLEKVSYQVRKKQLVSYEIVGFAGRSIEFTEGFVLVDIIPFQDAFSREKIQPLKVKFKISSQKC